MSVPEQDMLTQLGASPSQIDRELKLFREAARVLSSDHPRLIDLYPNKWVAVYEGDAVASDETFELLLERLKEQCIPRQQVIVRFIEKNRRTMIL